MATNKELEAKLDALLSQQGQTVQAAAPATVKVEEEKVDPISNMNKRVNWIFWMVLLLFSFYTIGTIGSCASTVTKFTIKQLIDSGRIVPPDNTPTPKSFSDFIFNETVKKKD